jgi:hypothetical protein
MIFVKSLECKTSLLTSNQGIQTGFAALKSVKDTSPKDGDNLSTGITILEKLWRWLQFNTPVLQFNTPVRWH